jgi:hypothetical protein
MKTGNFLLSSMDNHDDYALNDFETSQAKEKPGMTGCIFCPRNKIKIFEVCKRACSRPEHFTGNFSTLLESYAVSSPYILQSLHLFLVIRPCSIALKGAPA